MLSLAILGESRGMFPWTSVYATFIYVVMTQLNSFLGGPRGGGGK